MPTPFSASTRGYGSDIAEDGAETLSQSEIMEDGTEHITVVILDAEPV